MSGVTPRWVESDISALAVECRRALPPVADAAQRCALTLRSLLPGTHLCRPDHDDALVQMISAFLLACNYGDAPKKVALLAATSLGKFITADLVPSSCAPPIVRVLEIQATHTDDEVRLKVLQLLSLVLSQLHGALDATQVTQLAAVCFGFLSDKSPVIKRAAKASAQNIVSLIFELAQKKLALGCAGEAVGPQSITAAACYILKDMILVAGGLSPQWFHKPVPIPRVLATDIILEAIEHHALLFMLAPAFGDLVQSLLVPLLLRQVPSQLSLPLCMRFLRIARALVLRLHAAFPLASRVVLSMLVRMLHCAVAGEDFGAATVQTLDRFGVAGAKILKGAHRMLASASAAGGGAPTASAVVSMGHGASASVGSFASAAALGLPFEMESDAAGLLEAVFAVPLSPLPLWKVTLLVECAHNIVSSPNAATSLWHTVDAVSANPGAGSSAPASAAPRPAASGVASPTAAAAATAAALVGAPVSSNRCVEHLLDAMWLLMQRILRGSGFLVRDVVNADASAGTAAAPPAGHAQSSSLHAALLERDTSAGTASSHTSAFSAAHAQGGSLLRRSSAASGRHVSVDASGDLAIDSASHATSSQGFGGAINEFTVFEGDLEAAADAFHKRPLALLDMADSDSHVFTSTVGGLPAVALPTTSSLSAFVGAAVAGMSGALLGGGSSSGGGGGGGGSSSGGGSSGGGPGGSSGAHYVSAEAVSPPPDLMAATCVLLVLDACVLLASSLPPLQEVRASTASAPQPSPRDAPQYAVTPQRPSVAASAGAVCDADVAGFLNSCWRPLACVLAAGVEELPVASFNLMALRALQSSIYCAASRSLPAPRDALLHTLCQLAIPSGFVADVQRQAVPAFFASQLAAMKCALNVVNACGEALGSGWHSVLEMFDTFEVCASQLLPANHVMAAREAIHVAAASQGGAVLKLLDTEDVSVVSPDRSVRLSPASVEDAQALDCDAQVLLASLRDCYRHSAALSDAAFKRMVQVLGDMTINSFAESAAADVSDAVGGERSVGARRGSDPGLLESASLAAASASAVSSSVPIVGATNLQPGAAGVQLSSTSAPKSAQSVRKAAAAQSSAFTIEAAAADDARELVGSPAYMLHQPGALQFHTSGPSSGMLSPQQPAASPTSPSVGDVTTRGSSSHITGLTGELLTSPTTRRAGILPLPRSLMWLVEACVYNCARLGCVWDTLSALLRILARNRSSVLRGYGLHVLLDLALLHMSSAGDVEQVAGSRVDGCDEDGHCVSHGRLLEPLVEYWRCPYVSTRADMLTALHEWVTHLSTPSLTSAALKSDATMSMGAQAWGSVLGVVYAIASLGLGVNVTAHVRDESAVAAEEEEAALVDATTAIVASASASLTFIDAVGSEGDVATSATSRRVTALLQDACLASFPKWLFEAPDIFAASLPRAMLGRYVATAFQIVDVMVDEQLEHLPTTTCVVLLLVLQLFARQDYDLNIALRAVNLILAVSTFLRNPTSERSPATRERDFAPVAGLRELEQEGPAAWFLLFDVLIHICSGASWMHLPVRAPGACGTPASSTPTSVASPGAGSLRQQVAFVQASMPAAVPEVRNAAVQILFDTLVTHGSTYSADMWQELMYMHLLPLVWRLTTVSQLSLSDTTRLTGATLGVRRHGVEAGEEKVRILLHHSRDTLGKQWNETRVLAYQGLTKCVCVAFHTLSSATWFVDVWTQVLALLERSVVGPTGGSAQAGGVSPPEQLHETTDVAVPAVACAQMLGMLVILPLRPARSVHDEEKYTFDMRVVDGALVRVAHTQDDVASMWMQAGGADASSAATAGSEQLLVDAASPSAGGGGGSSSVRRGSAAAHHSVLASALSPADIVHIASVRLELWEVMLSTLSSVCRHAAAHADEDETVCAALAETLAALLCAKPAPDVAGCAQPNDVSLLQHGERRQLLMALLWQLFVSRREARWRIAMQPASTPLAGLPLLPSSPMREHGVSFAGAADAASPSRGTAAGNAGAGSTASPRVTILLEDLAAPKLDLSSHLDRAVLRAVEAGLHAVNLLLRAAGTPSTASSSCTSACSTVSSSGSSGSSARTPQSATNRSSGAPHAQLADSFEALMHLLLQLCVFDEETVPLRVSKHPAAASSPAPGEACRAAIASAAHTPLALPPSAMCVNATKVLDKIMTSNFGLLLAGAAAAAAPRTHDAPSTSSTATVLERVLVEDPFPHCPALARAFLRVAQSATTTLVQRLTTCRAWYDVAKWAVDEHDARKATNAAAAVAAARSKPVPDAGLVHGGLAKPSADSVSSGVAATMARGSSGSGDRRAELDTSDSSTGAGKHAGGMSGRGSSGRSSSPGTPVHSPLQDRMRRARGSLSGVERGAGGSSRARLDAMLTDLGILSCATANSAPPLGAEGSGNHHGRSHCVQATEAVGAASTHASTVFPVKVWGFGLGGSYGTHGDGSLVMVDAGKSSRSLARTASYNAALTDIVSHLLLAHDVEPTAGEGGASPLPICPPLHMWLPLVSTLSHVLGAQTLCAAVAAAGAEHAAAMIADVDTKLLRCLPLDVHPSLEALTASEAANKRQEEEALRAAGGAATLAAAGGNTRGSRAGGVAAGVSATSTPARVRAHALFHPAAQGAGSAVATTSHALLSGMASPAPVHAPLPLTPLTGHLALTEAVDLRACFGPAACVPPAQVDDVLHAQPWRAACRVLGYRFEHGAVDGDEPLPAASKPRGLEGSSKQPVVAATSSLDEALLSTLTVHVSAVLQAADVPSAAVVAAAQFISMCAVASWWVSAPLAACNATGLPTAQVQALRYTARICLSSLYKLATCARGGGGAHRAAATPAAALRTALWSLLHARCTRRFEEFLNADAVQAYLRFSAASVHMPGGASAERAPPTMALVGVASVADVVVHLHILRHLLAHWPATHHAAALGGVFHMVTRGVCSSELMVRHAVYSCLNQFEPLLAGGGGSGDAARAATPHAATPA